jgi:hypothetical protein
MVRRSQLLYRQGVIVTGPGKQGVNHGAIGGLSRPIHLQRRTSSKTNTHITSAKGFGDEPQHRLQDTIREQRTKQIAATDLLAKLVSAETSAKAVAQQHIDSLSEEFFHVAAAFVQLSEREGDKETTKRLRAAVQAAMEVKQSTLRPEIQLLNRLLAVETDVQRKQILNPAAIADVLVSDNRYFFSLLKRMQNDVERQHPGEAREQLLVKLNGIERDALARLPKA